MGSHILILVDIMNKIFLAFFVFGFAIAAAQPTKQSQCVVNEKAVTNLANLVDRVAKGQIKNDCLGYVAELTGTIIACALEVETGVGIAACVAQVVVTANGCYPCICWVIESLGYSC